MCNACISKRRVVAHFARCCGGRYRLIVRLLVSLRLVDVGAPEA